MIRGLVVLFNVLVLISCTTMEINDQYPKEETNNFSISFLNNTDKLACYSLYWIDHSFAEYPGPANMAGGELKPGKVNELENKYPYGLWVVRWTGCGRDNFSLTREIKINKSIVKSSPTGEIMHNE